MQHVKRIEIITDAVQLRDLLGLLERHGVSGYSVFHRITGAGDRGEQRGDELTGTSENVCVLIALPPEHAGEIVEAMRPMLKKRGGICLVSDAQWVRH
jgi:nitrogen regulatory protein PII